MSPDQIKQYIFISAIPGKLHDFATVLPSRLAEKFTRKRETSVKSPYFNRYPNSDIFPHKSGQTKCPKISLISWRQDNRTYGREQRKVGREKWRVDFTVKIVAVEKYHNIVCVLVFSLSPWKIGREMLATCWWSLDEWKQRTVKVNNRMKKCRWCNHFFKVHGVHSKNVSKLQQPGNSPEQQFY